MTQSRSIALIFFSLLLLVVFEALWLHRVWREQYASLQQESDYLFQQSVAALQDTLVYNSMRRNGMLPDSTPAPGRKIRIRRGTQHFQPDSIVQGLKFESNAKIVVRMDADSGEWLQPDKLGNGQFQVFVLRTNTGDTSSIGGLDRLLLNLPEQFRLPAAGHQLYKFEKNTIPILALKNAYRKNMEAAGIPLDFEIIRKDSLPFAPASKGIFTKPAKAGLLVQQYYAAVLPNYQTYLLRQILPALAFALLLFGVTTTAFFLIYRSMRQQQRLTRLKNEFISNITHELKTPITTVGVALEALSSFEVRDNPNKSREYLAHSKLELDRLSLLVEKVLRLSMFEEQAPRLKLEPLDLRTIVQQVTAAMALQAERAGARIQLNIPEQEQFQFIGDRLHLASVIFNLLDNALKYTGQQPEISVSLEKATDQIRLQVRDNGIGIPEALQTKVFDKFFRIQDGDRHDVKGHGLGLSYTATVVQQHGGRIWVESKPGEGSVFTVEFPSSVATQHP